MNRQLREAMWQKVLITYKRLVTGDRLLLTDRQLEFKREVDKRCFGRVYMFQPTDHITNKLYNMTQGLPT